MAALPVRVLRLRAAERRGHVAGGRECSQETADVGEGRQKVEMVRQHKCLDTDHLRWFLMGIFRMNNLLLVNNVISPLVHLTVRDTGVGGARSEFGF